MPNESPFRDELEAAHARIAQLQEANAALMRKNAALQSGPRPSKADDGARKKALVAGAVGVVAVTMGVAVMAVAVPRTGPSHRAPAAVAETQGSFNGVALSPPSSGGPRVVPIEVSPPSTTGPQPPLRHARTTTCNCTPGDPLCSCL